MASILVVNPRKGVYKSNPGKKKGGAKRKRARSRKRSGGAVSAARRPTTTVTVSKVTRYRQNPRGLIGSVTQAIVPAAMGAGGALAADIALGYIPLPDAMRAGPMRHLTRGLASIAVGILAGFVLKPDKARIVMGGGLTVAFHSLAREALQKAVPDIRLGDMDEDLGAFESELNALLANEQSMGALALDPTGGVAGFDPAFSGFGEYSY